jgi:thiol-disulfide isomerase/thioredoxin
MQLRIAGLGLVVVLALGIGWWRRRVDGHSRAVSSGEFVTAEHLGTPLGAVATLLQISSAVCAPCRAARRVLAEVADRTPGVRHIELDAEQHLDLVRRLDVLRTPTVLVLDGAGTVVARSSGVPTPAQVAHALDRVPGSVDGRGIRTRPNAGIDAGHLRQEPM